jgi:exosortase
VRATAPSGALLAVVLTASWVYAPVLVGLARQWSTDENYSHGVLVLPLAALFAFQRRDVLRQAEVRSSRAGVVVLAVSLVTFAAGVLGAELFLTRVSLIGVIWGTVLFVWGRRHARIVAFPLAFLLFMIPLPAIVLNQLTFPLQLLASRVGEALIRVAGIPVLRDGNLLHLPARTLEIAEACSGVRSLVSLIMMAVLLGYAGEQRRAGRVALALAAVPIAVITNGLRVAGTGLAAEWIGPAAAEGVFHTFSGWVVFIAACAALLLLQRFLPNRATARMAAR